MTDKNELKNTNQKEQCRHGNKMSDKELEQYFQDFSDIDESIGLVMEEGEDL